MNEHELHVPNFHKEQSMSQFLGALRNLLSTQRSNLAELQRKGEELRRQRDALAYQPAAKSDIERFVTSWVDAKSASYSQHLRAALNPLIVRPANIPQRPDAASFSLFGAVQPMADRLSPAELDEALCALFPEEAKAALLRQVAAMEWPEGQPLATRTAKLESLDSQIHSNQQEQARLLEEADRAGVNLLAVPADQ